MKYTFLGGIRLNEHKGTSRCPIVRISPPSVVTIPMSQHIGAPCTPVVSAGDIVDKGQVIGIVEKGLGCPVHASISGKVKEIVSVNNSAGIPVKSVVIENDFRDRVSPTVVPYIKALNKTTADEIISIVRDAGISGLGGASFPTYAKIQSALEKVDTVIVNCAECEPYITVNHRLLLENPMAVVNGLKIILKALGLRSGIIAVEDNKMSAVRMLESLDLDPKMIKVKVLVTKYPQGDERQLIYALTGKELPSGKLPADVGCVIFNAETCAAIYNAFSTGMPLIERIVTVAGDCIAKPSNLLVPIGTPFKDIIAFCGGFTKAPKKVISGGPMMGIAQWSLDTPVIKGTSAVLAFSEELDNNKKQLSACIRCGRCVRNCPMHLMPLYIASYAQQDDIDKCEKYDALSCVECGTCTYNCPGNVEIVQYIRVAKSKIIERNKQKATAAKREN